MKRKTISKLLPAILCACTVAGCSVQSNSKQIDTEETTKLKSEVESEDITESADSMETITETDEIISEGVTEKTTEQTTTVTIEGNLVESESIEKESYTYNIEIYETENQERYATIAVQKNASTITTLKVENDEWGDEFPSASNMINEEDVNFDGRQDILVKLGQFGENADNRYKCYIDNAENLEYCNGFEQIDNPDVYSDMQMIVGYAKGDSDLVTYNRYEYIDNSIENIDSVEVTREKNVDIYDEIFFDIMFNREQADIKTAYQYIIDSYQKLYDACKYDLIYFDNDDIPELVVGIDGYFSSMYTFSDGSIYALMHNWPYGVGGNHGYQYMEKTGIIYNYNTDYAGLEGYSTYYEITDEHSIAVKYCLRAAYEDESGNIIQDTEEIEEDKWKYYYDTDETEEVEISKSEYESYDILNVDEYKSMYGQYTEEEIMGRLN